VRGSAGDRLFDVYTRAAKLSKYIWISIIAKRRAVPLVFNRFCPRAQPRALGTFFFFFWAQPRNVLILRWCFFFFSVLKSIFRVAELIPPLHTIRYVVPYFIWSFQSYGLKTNVAHYPKTLWMTWNLHTASFGQVTHQRNRNRFRQFSSNLQIFEISEYLSICCSIKRFSVFGLQSRNLI